MVSQWLHRKSIHTFIASLDASDANRSLGSFLYEAADALDLRSDADLARIMKVSPVTLASWKRRNKLPPEQVKWFQTVFPTLVFDRGKSSLPSYSSTAVKHALAAISRYYGASFSEPESLNDAANAFGGLIAFVPLIANTHFDYEKDEAVHVSEEFIEKALADALEWRAKQLV